MKLHYLFIFFLITPILSFAQSSNVKYKVSPPYEAVAKKISDFKFFSNKKLGITVSYKIDYMSDYRGSDAVHMQSYDTEFMKIIARNKLNKNILNFTWLKDRFYAFYESGTYICAREIDYKSCEFKGKEIQLFSTDKIIFQRYLSKRLIDLVIKKSADESKLLIYAFHRGDSPNKPTAINHVSLLTVSQSFEETSFHKYKMSDPEEQIEDRDFMIDNNGIPYMIYKVYKDNIRPLIRSQMAKEKSNYHVNLFKFDLKEKKQAMIKIPFETSFLGRNIALFQGKNNQVIVTGYYNINKENKGVFKYKNVEGGFFISVNSLFELSPIKSYPINKKLIFKYTEFWKNFTKGIKMREIPTEFKYLTVRDLIIEEDHSMTIIGEQYYSDSYTSETLDGGERTSTNIYYDNILITKLDKDGEIIWMTKVPKKMKGLIDMDASGYIHTKVNESHYFFIHEDRDNEELKDNGEIIRERTEHHGNFSLFKVNSNTGKLSKHIIFDMMKVNGVKAYDLRMDRLMWYSDNEFILECYKKKKEDVMIKIQIKE